MPVPSPKPIAPSGLLANRITSFKNRVDSLRLNDSRIEDRDGIRFVVKRRNRSAPYLVPIANMFFRVAGNPVKVIASPAQWAAWEVCCFNRLHSDRFRAFAENGEVWTSLLPGTSLSAHLDNGTLTPVHCAMAAAEFRRAHAMQSRFCLGPWSHGDPHLDNFIADPADGVARLIDFEVHHERLLAPEVRHADDLMVFLLDLCGRAPAEMWLPCARALLDAYDSRPISTIVASRLTIPSGPARLWWAVRTSWTETPELCRRLAELRASL